MLSGFIAQVNYLPAYGAYSNGTTHSLGKGWDSHILGKNTSGGVGVSLGEGNSNPLQCSCLENPRDGGAWWAAVCGVTQSWTQMKRLSSSSSRGEPDGLRVYIVNFPKICSNFFPKLKILYLALVLLS